MRNQLPSNHISKAKHLAILEKELTALEDKLKSPSHATEDLVRHMETLKEYNGLLNCNM